MSDRDLTRPPTDARLAHLAASIARAEARSLAQRQHHQGSRAMRPPVQPYMMPVLPLAVARQHLALAEAASGFEAGPSVPPDATGYIVIDGRRVAMVTDLAK